MSVYKAFITGIRKPKEAAEFFVNYPNRKTGILIGIVSIVLANVITGFSNFGNYGISNYTLLRPFITLLCIFLSYGLLRLFHGEGSISKYFSSIGWTGIINIIAVLALLVRNLKPESSIISFSTATVFFIIGTYDFVLTITISAVAMNLSRMKAFLAQLISSVPIIIFSIVMVMGQLSGFYTETANYNQGNKDYQAGHYDQALIEFNKGLAAAPKKAHPTKSETNLNHKVLNGKGLTLYALNKSEDAIEAFNQSLALDLNDAKVYNNRGLAESKLNDYTHAATDFNKSISLNPLDKVPYFNNGTMLVKQGKIAEARDMFNQALKIDPNYAKALSALQSLDKQTVGQ